MKRGTAGVVCDPDSGHGWKTWIVGKRMSPPARNRKIQRVRKTKQRRERKD